jgi:hypothetical protein
MEEEEGRESASATPVFQILTPHLLNLHGTKPTFTPLYQDLTAVLLVSLLLLPTTPHLKNSLMRAMAVDPIT